MKLSIVVPVYNAEKYLRPCLDSLLAQTLRDFEIIAVNDGSKDASLAILEEYAAREPERLRILSVENGGQGRARNLGIELARGEWLGFADSDDWVEPEMYEKLLRAAEAECADMAMCDCVEYHADGRTVYANMTAFDDPMQMPTAVWNKLIRRELAAGIRFPERLWYEDLYYVAMLLMRVGKIASVHEGLYCYRIGQLSTMNNQNAKKNLDMLTIMELLRPEMERAGRRDDFESLLVNHVLLESVKRLALQHSPDKLAVIAKLRAYVRGQIPDLRRCEAYRRESRNRRIIMWMNYMGLEDLALLILRVKKSI